MNESNAQGKILIIDDDKGLSHLVRVALAGRGFSVAVAHDGQEGLEAFQRELPDLVVLDVMMPELDGREVCVRLRERSAVPILFLTANSAGTARIEGLHLGADDYVVKPFDIDELVARIEALLRRTRLQADKPPRILRFSQGALVLNLERRQAYLNGEQLHLTSTEYDLLAFLAQSAGRPLTVSTIYNAVWPYDSEADPKVVRWYIWRLRQKLEPDPAHPQVILTEPGIGYRFSPL